MAIEIVKSAKRVIEVLEHFAEARRPMTGTEIAEMLSYPKSSTNALLRSLVAMGYLDLDDLTKSYFPTMRVGLLGSWLPLMLPNAINLEALVLRVQERTNETVTLSTQADLEMVFARVLPSTHPIALNLKPGSRAPLLESAVGLALLASMKDDQVARIIRRSGYGSTRAKSAERAALNERIATVRSNGYAIVYDRVLPDTGALATALPISPPGAPIVLGVGGPIDRIRFNEAAIAAVLLDIVGELKR